MENEQISSTSNDIKIEKMPIKKAFAIIGLGLSLSVILLNIVQIFVVNIVIKNFPTVYSSDFFRFAASTIPLTVIGMPVLFGVTSFIPSAKTSYKSNISVPKMLKIFVISYVSMTILNMVSLVINMMISGITGLSATNPLEFIQGSNIWITLLFAVVLSPIVEEIMFRHIIINKLRNYGSGVAIFTSAFAFALYHGNLYQILYAFVLGIVFGAVVYKTGKLRYAIILHIMVNFCGTVLPIGIASQKPILMAVCAVTVIGILLTGFILGIITLCKTDFGKLGQDIMPRQHLKPFFLNIGMISYIIVTLIVIVLFLMG